MSKNITLSRKMAPWKDREPNRMLEEASHEVIHLIKSLIKDGHFDKDFSADLAYLTDEMEKKHITLRFT